ncbi:hypothetical protein M433DRAFT_337351 [Acidomyces richmondensis BFW]|nr:MAG: hypothetical protein FE78DRAFT_478843 [Acidomyces sp. 'richmondensis']KYG43731.1 hypothetical protein M433DRAFT_337351 [Acidomyces richmondensis BFW]
MTGIPPPYHRLACSYILARRFFGRVSEFHRARPFGLPIQGYVGVPLLVSWLVACDNARQGKESDSDLKLEIKNNAPERQF